MMLLANKDGIRCDFCGREFKSKFTYYSYDCHMVSVDISRMETKREEVMDINGSIIGYDVCEECHKNNLNKMLENQK
jgi:hypothetical protein